MIGARSRLGNVVAGLGAAIGLAIAILGPLGFGTVTYAKLDHEMAMLSELKAARLAKYIYVHRDLWQYSTLRLAELTEVPEAGEVNTHQRLIEPSGKLVLDSGERPDAPVGRWSAPVVVAGATLARVETAASLRPLLIATLAVALLSGLLGLAAYFVIRILPLRIIDRALADLDVAEARYRLLFDVNPVPMVVVQRDTKAFLAVNQAAIEHYGWSREEFLRMTIADMRPPGDVLPERMVDLLRTPRGDAATFPGQRHLRKDGTIIEVEITSRAIDFEGKPAALSLALDVTDRNRAEAARLLSDDKLRQSQKMEAVGKLTGGIAHDFNNILMIILSNVEALEEESLRPALKTSLAAIGGAVDRAAELIRQLLAFSRQQPLRAQTIDINALVAGTSKLLRRLLGAQIEIEEAPAVGLWPVCVDRTQLETALVNLCINARDAMPSGGRLRIETHNRTLDEAAVAPWPDVAAGDYVLLAVTDSGAGMTPDILAKVFEPFFTTKEMGKGTGLGLAMVYGFVKQSNGHIEVDSTPGRGTRFRLYLPRVTAVVAPTGPLSQPPVVGGNERILVVEDEPNVRAHTVELLIGLGYDVTRAADGMAGLAACEAAASPFDLVLTDVIMPRLDGKALAQAVARRWPATRIVFMSGYTDGEILGEIDDSALLLNKPFRKADLARAIRQALAAAEPLTP